MIGPVAACALGLACLLVLAAVGWRVQRRAPPPGLLPPLGRGEVDATSLFRPRMPRAALGAAQCDRCRGWSVWWDGGRPRCTRCGWTRPTLAPRSAR